MSLLSKSITSQFPIKEIVTKLHTTRYLWYASEIVTEVSLFPHKIRITRYNKFKPLQQQ